MKDQKAYHQRKLAIIEMIEECTDRIEKEEVFIESLPDDCFFEAVGNSTKNINRFLRIKRYLIERCNIK